MRCDVTLVGHVRSLAQNEGGTSDEKLETRYDEQAIEMCACGCVSKRVCVCTRVRDGRGERRETVNVTPHYIMVLSRIPTRAHIRERER